MAHFAEIDEETNEVLNVLKVPDEQEHRGQEYLAVDCNLGGKWIQTSYNTRGGVYYDSEWNVIEGNPGLRKNYAKIGGFYDPVNDAFHGRKPADYPSFVLDPYSFLWRPPIPMPTSLPEGTIGHNWAYVWDEENLTWVLRSTDNGISHEDILNNSELLEALKSRFEQQQLEQQQSEQQ